MTMCNAVWGSMLLLCSVLGIFVFAKAYQRRNESGVSKWLMAICISNALWAFVVALMQFLPEYSMVLLVGSPRFALIMASGWLCLFFVLRAMFGYEPPKKMLIGVGVLVLADLVIAAINPGNMFYIYAEDFVYRGQVRGFTAQLGPWFIVHALLSYIPILVALIILVWQFLRLPRRHKATAALMFISILSLIATSLIAMLELFGVPVDLTPAMSNLVSVLFYYALFHTSAMDIIAASREAFFENTESIVFVLDPRENIVDYNRQAGALVKSLDIGNPIKLPVDEVIRRWKISNNGRIHDADASIMSVYYGDAEEHYHFQKANFLRGISGKLGSYLEIQNITSIMSTLRLLQDYAFYDSLTGLPNRNYFTEKIASQKGVFQYPVCIWVGDVNLLKKINDTHGHSKGDELLVRIAEILRKCAPSDALIVRMGGDEFVGFFPNTTGERCEDYIRLVSRACADELTQEFSGVSIAMGYKVMQDENQDIHRLLDEADAEMYRNKRYDRRRNSGPREGSPADRRKC